MSAESTALGRMRWQRWRVIVYLVTGLLVLNGVIAARAELWKAYDPQFARDRVHYAQEHAWDLVVAGGSPAMCVDSTDLAGIVWNGCPLNKTFNLAVPYATTVEVYHAIEHGLVAPPRLLVYAIAVTDLNGARHEAMSPEWLMDRSDLKRWIGAHPEKIEWCLRHYVAERASWAFPLFQHREGIRLWAAHEAEQWWPGFAPEADALAQRGLGNSAGLRRCIDFRPVRPVPDRQRYDLRKAAGEKFDRFGPMEDYDPVGHVLYLDAIVEWARQHGTRLILVNVPVAEDFERAYPDAFVAYREALVRLQKRTAAQIIFATRAQTGLRDADYEDPLHMNGDGSARFGSWLRRTLSELPESRSEDGNDSFKSVPAITVARPIAAR